MKRLFFAIFLISLCRTGFSQTPEEVRAHELYKKARDFFEKAQYDEALKLLDEAYNYFPIPLILMKKGECYEKSGKVEEALAVYRSVESDDPKIKTKVEKKIKELTAIISLPVELTVITNVPGVETLIDSVDLYTTPFTVKISRGKHNFQFRKKGYRTVSTDYIVKGASPVIYRVDMEEVHGKVVITTDLEDLSGIKIQIDNKSVEIPESVRTQSKTEPLTVQIGTHTLSCSKNGGPPFVTTFEVVEESLTHANCRLGWYAAKDKTLGWITMGGALLSGGLGTYLLISYYNDKAKADEMGKVLQSNKQYFGPALIGLGVAAGVVSYFLLTGDNEPDVEAGYERFRPGFFASDGGVIFSASGRF